MAITRPRALRPLVCNCSDQQAGQSTQRSSRVRVKDLAAGVGGDLGGQPSEQPAERLGAVALQPQEVLELAYDALDQLPLTGRPTPVPLGPSVAASAWRLVRCGVAATKAPCTSNQRRSHATEENPASAR